MQDGDREKGERSNSDMMKRYKIITIRVPIT
jgi:hypothetical protein